MVDVAVFVQRVELTGVHAQHRAALHPSRDYEVVARGDGVHLRGVAVHDDVDRLGTGCEMVGKIGAETRATLSVCGSARGQTSRARSLVRPAGARIRRLTAWAGADAILATSVWRRLPC